MKVHLLCKEDLAWQTLRDCCAQAIVLDLHIEVMWQAEDLVIGGFGAVQLVPEDLHLLKSELSTKYNSLALWVERPPVHRLLKPPKAAVRAACVVLPRAALGSWIP